MYEAEPAAVPLRQLDRLHAEYPASLVGQRYAARRVVALPPPYARQPLRRLEPRFAFAKAAEGDEIASASVSR